MKKEQRMMDALDKELKACEKAYQELCVRAQVLLKEDVSLLNAKGRADILERHNALAAEFATVRESIRVLNAEIEDYLRTI